MDKDSIIEIMNALSNERDTSTSLIEFSFSNVRDPKDPHHSYKRNFSGSSISQVLTVYWNVDVPLLEINPHPTSILAISDTGYCAY